MNKFVFLSSVLILASCSEDHTLQGEPWEIDDGVDMTPAHDALQGFDEASDLTLEDISVDLVGVSDARKEMSCKDDVWTSSPDFESTEEGWRRVFEPLEHEGAFYQAALSIVAVGDSEVRRWYVRITQRMCVDGDTRRAMWLTGSKRVLDDLPDDYPHLLGGGVFTLTDDAGHSFAPTCLQLLNLAGPLTEEIVPYPAHIEPGSWESLESDDNFAIDLSYPLRGWIDTDPRHMEAEYYTRALDYEDDLGVRMYWPILHSETFSADPSEVTIPASVCLETGWPVDPRGFVTSTVDGTYVVQNIPELNLPEEILSIIRGAE